MRLNLNTRRKSSRDSENKLRALKISKISSRSKFATWKEISLPPKKMPKNGNSSTRKPVKTTDLMTRKSRI